METKTCTKCKLPKELDQFNKLRNGHSSYCKECNKSNLKKHYTENKQYYVDKQKEKRIKTREKCNEYKRGLVCTRCKFSFKDYPSVCEFHHTDKNKEIDPSSAINYSWNKFIAEVKKCIPLCANCHRIIHSDLNCPIV